MNNGRKTRAGSSLFGPWSRPGGTGTTTPFDPNDLTPAQIQTLKGLLGIDQITGQFLGANNTFAALPVVDADGDPATNGDWAILRVDDGANDAGIYVYDGVSFIFSARISGSETVLINQEVEDGVFYPFSTGESWADIKSNYSHLRVVGNAKTSGGNNIRPYSFIVDPVTHTLAQDETGWRLEFGDNQNAARLWFSNPIDTDTGLTVEGASLATPLNGRMQMKVVGVKVA